jgi:phospholipid transport system substrate-binding protein
MRRLLPQTIITSLLILSICSIPLITQAVPSTKVNQSQTPATDFLKSQVATVLKLTALAIPNARTKKEIDTKLLGLIKPMMDFPAMSQASLGKHWTKQSAKQQERFINLFQELVFHSYMKKIRTAKNDTQITYEDESSREQGGAEVEAIAATKKVEVELRFLLRVGDLKKEEAQFVAEDIIIDEVSLVNNYREEFNKIITKEGFDGLIKKMEKQVQKVR